jgi:hypothetical protein
MPQIELETLLTWLDPARKPLLVQLPAPEYGRLIDRWKLPTSINVPSRNVPSRNVPSPNVPSR